MRIQYTNHAKDQIRKRKIHFVWIEEKIQKPDTKQKGGKKYWAKKKLNGKTLKVVYVKEEAIKVITAFFL